MKYVLHDKLDDFVAIYLDNFLVFSPSIEEHEAHLHWVFNQLQKHSLEAKMKKVLFWCGKIRILGTHSHTIWCYSGPRKN